MRNIYTILLVITAVILNCKAQLEEVGFYGTEFASRKVYLYDRNFVATGDSHKALCTSANASPLQLDTLEEQIFFFAVVRSHPEIGILSHIGAHKIGNDWIWHSNETIGYPLKWYPGKDTGNYGRNPCLTIVNDQAADGVGFGEFFCNDGEYNFFCQKVGSQ